MLASDARTPACRSPRYTWCAWEKNYAPGGAVDSDAAGQDADYRSPVSFGGIKDQALEWILCHCYRLPTIGVL